MAGRRPGPVLAPSRRATAIASAACGLQIVAASVDRSRTSPPGGHVNRRRPNRPARIAAGKDFRCENTVAASEQYMGVKPGLRDRLRTGPDVFAALGEGYAQAVYRYPPG